MKNVSHSTIFVFLYCLCLIALYACSSSPVEKFNDWMGWGDDNLLEETAEFVIQEEIGVNLDLTPRSKE